MSPRSVGRTEAFCSSQARIRLRQAEKFGEVAALVLDEPVDSAPGVAAALAVLAGIAAADAMFGAVLGQRSRGQDHRQAADLLHGVNPDGSRMAKALRELLDLKDASHYAPIMLTRRQGQAALRPGVLVESRPTVFHWSVPKILSRARGTSPLLVDPVLRVADRRREITGKPLLSRDRQADVPRRQVLVVINKAAGTDGQVDAGPVRPAVQLVEVEAGIVGRIVAGAELHRDDVDAHG
jgi:hypothetical protein